MTHHLEESDTIIHYIWAHHICWRSWHWLSVWHDVGVVVLSGMVDVSVCVCVSASTEGGGGVLPLYFNPTSHFLENLNKSLDLLTQSLDLIVMTK